MKQNKGYHIEIIKPKVSKKIQKKIENLNIQFIKSKEKVAYYYENITTGLSFSFNKDITFYAASTIKILIVLYLLDNNCDLEKEITIQKTDIKQGSGVIKNDNLPQKYTIKKLMELTLNKSDNTAYLKLIEFVGSEKLKNYGKSLNATHTLEGKDNYGLITCKDLSYYWHCFWILQKEYPDLVAWTKNPNYHIIKAKSLKNKIYLRKYGSHEIAYHESGVVLDKEPYLLIILTQKGQNKKADKFINNAAKKINEIHQLCKF